MSSYSTRQRKALLAYLSRHPDELLSARQIADALADEKISLSAVYRNLAQLEAEEKSAAQQQERHAGGLLSVP